MFKISIIAFCLTKCIRTLVGFDTQLWEFNTWGTPPGGGGNAKHSPQVPGLSYVMMHDGKCNDHHVFLIIFEIHKVSS